MEREILLKPGPLNLICKTKKKPMMTIEEKSGVKKPKVETDLNANGVNNEDYLVESLLGKKFVRGAPHYLVKWIGWPHSANTWEPVEHLSRCMWIVAGYERAQRALADANEHMIADAKIKIENDAVEEREGLADVLPGSQLQDVKVSVNGGGAPELRKCPEKRSRYKKKPTRRFSSDDDSNDEVSEDDFSEVDIRVGVLKKCPRGKRVERIRAVTSVGGILQFLVQWKSAAESNNSTVPPLSPTNSNIVMASSMNNKFPQEVIQFYVNRIRFFSSLEKSSEEDKKAVKALKLSKERRISTLSKSRKDAENPSESDDDDAGDNASKAIEKERRKLDQFNVDDSEFSFSSSASDEDILNKSEGEDEDEN